MMKRKIQYETWKRVTGPDLDPFNEKRRRANNRILKSETFLRLCSKLGIEATKRQASKFKNKKGLVYKYAKLNIPLTKKEKKCQKD